MNISDIDDMVDEISDWFIQGLKDVEGSLAPDDNIYGMNQRNDAEKLKEYMKIRDNPMAAYQYMDGKAKELIDGLIKDGVPQLEIAAMKPTPYDIVIAHTR